MKKNVFIISTEYHLMEAVSYIVNRFNTDEFENYIYQLSRRDSKRFDRFNIRHEFIPAHFQLIEYDAGVKYEKEFKDSLNKLLALNPEKLFFFDEGHYWIPYLIRKLKRKGCVICMGPDGSNAYGNDDLTFKYIYRYIIRFLRFVYSHRLIPPFYPIIKRHHYAYTPGIDELWLEFPEKFNNFYGKKLIKQPVLNKSQSIDIVSKIFDFDYDRNCLREEWNDAILIIDNPYGERTVDKMIEIVKAVRQRYPNYRLYIKAHPGTSQNAIDKYRKELDGVSFLANNFPAELYILSFRHSMILSIYSTSMLCNNPQCRFFWLYPMFYGRFAESLIINMDNLTNPTEHIVVAENANVIEI